MNIRFEDLKVSSKPLLKLIKRGVKVRSIYEIGQDDDITNILLQLEYWQKLGEEIRITKKLPLKLLISDKSKVMVSLKNENNGKNNVTSMVVEHSDLTNALTELYEMHWNKAIPLSEFIISHKIKGR